MASESFLPLLEAVDNFDPTHSHEPLAKWFLDCSHTYVVGLLRPPVLTALVEYNSAHPTFSISPSSDNAPPKVAFLPELDTASKRSAAMKNLCTTWRDSGLFSDVIGGRKWRNELYGVYLHPYAYLRPENTAFAMERAACALFGVITYGVHMTMYTTDGGVKLWVPTRSPTKQRWPSYLDNTVAGGIPHGITPFQSMLKECEEEATLPSDLVAAHIKQVSSISYYSRTRTGWLEPEVQFVYEMFVPKGLVVDPKPSDGEVASFELCTLENVISKMFAKKFKPNCGAVIIDFLIRHGYLTAENEPNYLEIITRLHRRFPGYGTVSTT